MSTTDQTAELAAERLAVQRIADAHQRLLDRARRTAQGLADEAAESTEDGIRDLVDDDAEVDAAVQAALVRQTSDRAMHAARRVAELEARGAALAFGHTTDDDGHRDYVGRMSVLDGDDALLIDWRAAAAVPFYRSTPLDRLGVRHRRHLLYGGDGSVSGGDQLVGYSDEVFDLESLSSTTGLRGEAAILAAVTAPTQEQMRSVVATIQAEQDAVIRASSEGALVVQGGPGTGKTVVALHRAAYLLYDQRAAFADSGVLVVGPSNEFLRYIGGVLPSLGETGVVSVTAARLYPGILLGGAEPSEVAELKGRAEMAELLATAVSDRRRRPVRPLDVWYGSLHVRLDVGEGQRLFDQARRHLAHNDGADEFRSLVVDALAAEVYNPSFDNLDDARTTFRQSADVEEFLLRHFPPLTPERALRDLLGSAALVRSAAAGAGLSEHEGRQLVRPRVPEDEIDSIRWCDADVPLLDELQALLGGSMGQTEEERIRARDTVDEFQLAQERDLASRAPLPELDELIELPPEFDEDEPDVVSADQLAADAGLDVEEAEASSHDDRAVIEDVDDDDVRVAELDLAGADDLAEAGATVVELAFGQRSWRFGHVIVDEAQDLTPMQWRMIVRRARAGSMTIVGDLAQRSIGSPGAWRDHLPPQIADFSYQELSINYRSPAEINEVAATLLGELSPHLKPTRSIRQSGEAPEVRRAGSLDPDHVAEAANGLLGSEGTAAVIGLDLGDRPANLHDRIEWLDPWHAKGLEFDAVVIVEPAGIVADPHGLSLLYVAVTRTTGKLLVLHQRPLPAVMVKALGSADAYLGLAAGGS